MLRRSPTLLLIAGLTTLVVFTVFYNVSWRNLPQAVGLGDRYGPDEEEKANAIPDLRTGRPKPEGLDIEKGAFREPKVDSNSPYPVGQLKSPGGNYTKCLVISKLRREDASWIDTELSDMLDSGSLTKAAYVVDDRSAPLHPPKNKGHEVMVYLSYIIDSYDKRDLADISIFMHFHRYAWHNNELLNTDAALMVRHLSPERVTRDGYMNLRCHWDPGCPSWVHPGNTVRDPEKQEEQLLADAWAELFPLDPIPQVLAQPCCAQFAVSRERIRAIPKQRYVQLRDWILRTDLSDYLSGRVFEYIWQYIFTASPLHCPSMAACYCDGYGYCFGSPENFDKYFELAYLRKEDEEELRVWMEQAEIIETARLESKDGRFDEEAIIEVPPIGRDNLLKDRIAGLEREMQGMKNEAFERGKDPKQRAIEVGREWVEGDGY